jgi:hypothetical protein
MPTASTLPMILVALVVWAFAKCNLLSVVMFMGIFQAASMVDVGDQGIVTWTFVLVVGLMLKVAAGTLRLTVPDDVNRTAVRLVFAFLAYASISGLVYPLLFRGIRVKNSQMPEGGALALGSTNISQICYLVAAGAVFLIALASSREERRAALNWYVYGCLVAALFSGYQVLSAITKIPFPSAILYSTPNHIIFHPTISTVGLRLNSTFPEVSAMAPYMSVGVALLGWDLCTQPLSWRTNISLFVTIVALLCTESTTGYLALLFIGLSLVVLCIVRYLKTGIVSRQKIWMSFFVLTVVILLLAATNATQVMRTTFQTVVLDKSKTSSYMQRVQTNTAALQTARDTFYVGAGWGSVRCSSLIYGLIGTVGIGGCALFFGSMLAQYRGLFVGARRRVGMDDGYERSLLASATLVVAMAVSGNELVLPVLWVLFAIGVAGPQTTEGVPFAEERAFVRSYEALHPV